MRRTRCSYIKQPSTTIHHEDGGFYGRCVGVDGAQDDFMGPTEQAIPRHKRSKWKN